MAEELNTQQVEVVRKPRAVVRINDVSVPWESFEIDSHSTFDADTFRVSVPTSGLPVDLPIESILNGQSLRVEILAGFPSDANSYQANSLPSLFHGRTDDVSYDPQSRTLELSGRDFTGLLIDRKTTEKFRNLTASGIARILAGRVGLYPEVTDTTTLAGTYYNIDHARLTESMSEWDLLCWLAHEEGFLVYVKGQSLYFGPKPDPTKQIYTLRWDDRQPYSTANVEGLRLMRNLTVAKDVTVTVRSWGLKSKAVIAATYPKSKHKSAAPGSSGAAEPDGYVFNKPGLTYEQALQEAQRRHAEITAHEMRLEANLPGDSILTVFTPIQLIGTATPFDQTYYPYVINRRMSADEGYVMQVTAKNRAPDNQATL